MTPLECYKEYLLLKKHFLYNFDYFKYNGKSKKLSIDSFNKRTDKYFFEKLSKHSDVRGFLLSNIIEKDNYWVRDLVYNEEHEQIYKKWLKKYQSLTYVFKQDINKLNEKFNDNFLVPSNSHPILLKKYLSKDICLETLCILLDLSGAKDDWNKKMEHDFVWNELKLKIEKYTPFITYDKCKLRKICLDFFVA